MNRLDHLVTDNIRMYKDKINEAIYNEPVFDTSSFNSTRGTIDPLPVVTVTLQGGKKHRASTVACITWLWDSGDINILINI